jgi:Reverse transcriptase (RNA-dependent DNA polymerase)
MIGMSYQQINADHTVFARQHGGHIIILTVYVDDMIITRDDEGEIARLKIRLGKKFDVKDPRQLRYFLGIEMARGGEGIVLSQRKYVLDLLGETGMLGCKPTTSPIDVKAKMSADAREHVDTSPIDVKAKMSADAREHVDCERYQRLVGRLIYLSHARFDILFVVSVVSHYMHDPRKDHMDAIFYILRYLKSAPGNDLIFRNNGHINIEGYCDSDWASCQDHRRSTSSYCMFVGDNLVS